jgi:hypothetical protein
MSHEQQIRDTAAQTYINLKQNFATDNNYWQLGSAFDTMTDYLLVAGPAAADPGLPKIVQARFNDPAVQAYAGWYDDYA